MNAALLIIDLQEYFFRKPENRRDIEILVRKTNELVEYFHQEKRPIFRILTVHQLDGSTWDLEMKGTPWFKPDLIEGSEYAKELAGLKRYETDIEVVKIRTSAFVRTNLEELLRGHSIDAVVLAGTAIPFCMNLTAMDAYQRDFRVFLASEAIVSGPRYEEESKVALKVLQEHFGASILSNEELFSLLSSRAVP